MVETPEPVAYVRDLLRDFDRPWFLCGGWAADAWLGRQTREHVDVDIAVFHHDQRALFDYLPGWTLTGHDPNVPDDTTEPWNGRQLDLPAHIHVRDAVHEFEFLLNELSGGQWVFDRARHVTAPVDRCTAASPWGMRAVGPEIVLFFKADGPIRPQDERDFRVLLPTLRPAQRSWLRDAVRPDHPWQADLTPPR